MTFCSNLIISFFFISIVPATLKYEVCETLRLQKETLVWKKRNLELEINQLEMSLSYTT